MPKVGTNQIENLTHFQAVKKGYLTAGEALAHIAWIKENCTESHNNTFVYVNGEYKGVAKKNTSLFEIIEKFCLSPVK